LLRLPLLKLPLNVLVLKIREDVGQQAAGKCLNCIVRDSGVVDELFLSQKSNVKIYNNKPKPFPHNQKSTHTR